MLKSVHYPIRLKCHDGLPVLFSTFFPKGKLCLEYSRLLIDNSLINELKETDKFLAYLRCLQMIYLKVTLLSQIKFHKSLYVFVKSSLMNQMFSNIIICLLEF